VTPTLVPSLDRSKIITFRDTIKIQIKEYSTGLRLQQDMETTMGVASMASDLATKARQDFHIDHKSKCREISRQDQILHQAQISHQAQGQCKHHQAPENMKVHLNMKEIHFSEVLNSILVHQFIITPKCLNSDRRALDYHLRKALV